MRLARKPIDRKRSADVAVLRQTQRERHRYTLAELLAQCDLSKRLGKEGREWLDAPRVGQEAI